MTDFARGDIAAGGSFGYYEVLSKLAIFQQYVEAFDDVGNQMRVSGITVSPANEPYVCHDAINRDHDFAPHDLVWLPKVHAGAQLAVLIARLDNTLELWEYNLSGTVVTKHTGLDVDTSWNAQTQYCKLDSLCDGRTIYYTDRGRTIFRYHLDDGQLAPLTQLEPANPYIYAGFKIIPPSDHVIVAMSASGNGPSNAVCLDSDRVSFWCDEINPLADYHLFKRQIAAGIDGPSYQVVTTSLAPTVGGLPGYGNNGEVFALACWLGQLCAAQRLVQVTLIGAT